MTTEIILQLVEFLLVPVALFFLARFFKSYDRHNTNLYNKIDQFRMENTTSIKELGTEIKDTLMAHSEKLDDHNGRISTLEGMRAYGRRKGD